MKITYKFADGTISEVEVSEELGQAITTSRREEENYERKMRYHCPISIDQLEYQGIEFADPDTPFSLYERKLKEQEQKALEKKAIELEKQKAIAKNAKKYQVN